jgi:hypothetical protein
MNNYQLCCGNPEEKFTFLCKNKKGKVTSSSGTSTAIIHMARNGFETVRHVDSEVLVKEDGKTCAVCSKYRSTLRALHSKSAKTSTASTPIQTNIRYLGTPQQRRRILALKKKAKKVSMQNNRQFEKIKRLMKSSSCVEADLGLQNVLLESIRNYQEEINSLSQSDFKRLFWEQQVRVHECDFKFLIYIDICYEY